MKLIRFAKRTATWLLFAAMAAGQHVAAQSDNFDSGTLDPAWKKSNFNPGLVTTTFPDVGGGKGFRIRANPVPGAAPAAAMFYRDEVYTDFYMAVDLVDWPGTDLNQAMVLVARGALSGNPATTRGVILNYDASQYGQGPTSRRQGQLQINLVTDSPPFGTKTLAVAECTFVQGRSYRLIFKGVGSLYTGMAYDLTDLTQPVVTLVADDVEQGPIDTPFTSGVCGFLSFSREGTSGVTDVTIDNYYAGPSDPNPAASPALAHPVAGTPAIETRTPAQRHKNFHNPADGISFTAKTHTADVINAGATKLWLNGADVSSQLTLSANGASVTGSLPGSALAANKVYAAEITVEDTTGAKKSSNKFWFDTFSDAYLQSAGVKTIEAEDFNFDNGQFLPEPIAVSGIDKDGFGVNGFGVGYWELGSGTEGIDYHDLRSSPESPWSGEYRSFTPVGLSAGMYPEILGLIETSAAPVRRSDNVRSQFASSNLLEHVVHRTQVGEWLNYTRTFTAGTYAPHLRVASFGATTIELHRVTSDPTLPDQTTEKLGSFNVPNQTVRYNYAYIPLVDDAGQPVSLDLGGELTLRLHFAGAPGQDERKVAVNYLMFVPTPPTRKDNFDSGTLDPAWKKSNFNPGLVTTTFPDVGGGKGFRIRANPVPGAAPAAAMFYRDEVYTDFYMAVDLVDWPGTDLNQAMVLVARGALSGNPATTRGVILNYDASQYGQGPTSRRQGQLQINLVTDSPPFGTKTLAVAECTFVQGRSYRLIFKGVGSLYTGMAYDLTDLTQPVVTLVADDVEQGPIDTPFTSGVCGFLSFSREGTSGVTDVTIDNYYAGPSDPNPAASPALAHPVAGTPAIETRTPAQRHKNFHNPADGISFTAKTHTADVINAGATKLWLNGADVSSQLTLSANGASVTGSLPGSALAANKVYAAEITVEDTTGAKKSSNKFWFDTFSDAYLQSAGVKTIEAEDFNFDNGQFLPEPIAVSGIDKDGFGVNGFGVGYWELGSGTEGIDYHDLRSSPESPWSGEYRSFTPVGLSAGMYPEILGLIETSAAPVRRSDNVRSQFASSNLLEHVVHRTQVGEWLNYTRTFTAGTYAPHLRVASFGATTIELHRVTSDPTLPDQTTEKLGSFNVPNQTVRYNYAYIPLVDDAGQPVSLDLGGELTLRLHFAGAPGQDERKVAVNYLMFVPVPAEPRLAAALAGSQVTITWPIIPFRLQSSPGVGPANWTDVTSGVTTVGNQNSYTTDPSGTRLFRLISP